jgi:hypothetical protein
VDALHASDASIRWNDEKVEGETSLERTIKLLTERTVSSHEADKTDAEFILNNPSIFQWVYFYEEADLTLPSDNSWTNKLRERGDFFFTFIRLYCEHVKLTVVSKSSNPVAWHLLPGYNLLLSAFMKQLSALFVGCRECAYSRKKESASGWSESLKSCIMDCSATLLDNAPLINVFIKLAFENCNSYSCEAVEHCLRSLELWFDKFRSLNDSSLYNAIDKSTAVEDSVDVNSDLEPHNLAENMVYMTYIYTCVIIIVYM